MKKILFLLLFLPVLAKAQITTAAGNSVPISTAGSRVLYIEPTIYVVPTILLNGDVRCYIRAVTSTGTGGDAYMDFTAAYLNGLTPSGATTTAKFLNVCAQGVIVNLSALYGSNVFTNTY